MAELSNTEMPIEEESAENISFEKANEAIDTEEAELDSEGEEAAENKADETVRQSGNRSHLTSSVPKSARAPISAITKQEMAEIRSIFGDMDDSEIHRLYKRVTK